ncbi:MAG TPA: conjugal transfer protein TraN, partial [Sphingobium sp.]|nr:conjugal transfer protein TraN [Sphingobium sp.]
MRPARALLLGFILVTASLSLFPPTAMAQPLCAVDLNGNGDAADNGETARCHLTGSGGWMCPIGETPCQADRAGAMHCPLGDQYACAVPASGGAPTCSANSCIDTSANPIVEEPPVDDPGVEADGAIDADGNCLGAIEIFSGRAVRCRPAGLSTTFQNCCKDKGKILHDGMGGSISSISTK